MSGQYAWQDGSLPDRCIAMEKRREELQDELYSSAGEASPPQHLMAEWIALLQARNDSTKQMIDEENLRLKNEGILQMHRLLEEFEESKVVFEASDNTIKKHMICLHKELKAYCKKNKLDTRTRAPVPFAAAPPAPPPPPPMAAPPPPPPPMPVAFAAKAKPTDLSQSVASCVQTPRGAAKAPLKPINTDVLSAISSASRTRLRRTGCARSPGGTPARQKRRLSMSDSQDIITLALRNKFKNISDSPLRCKLKEIDDGEDVQTPSKIAAIEPEQVPIAQE